MGRAARALSDHPKTAVAIPLLKIGYRGLSRGASRCADGISGGIYPDKSPPRVDSPDVGPAEGLTCPHAWVKSVHKRSRILLVAT